MKLEKISIKSFAISVTFFVGIIAIIVLFVAGNYLKESALLAQSKSLSRIIEVASDETLRQIHNEALNFGNDLQNRAQTRRAIEQLLHSNQSDFLVGILDEPMRMGAVGLDKFELVKMRIYDVDMNFLCEGTEGEPGLPRKIPASLLSKVQNRNAIERLKNAESFWTFLGKPYYSLLIPIGGLHPSAYLELVIDPSFNFPQLAALANMPVSVFDVKGREIFQSENNLRMNELMKVDVEYMLKADSGEHLYRIIGVEKNQQFNDDIQNLRMKVVSLLLVMTIAVMLFVLWVFNKYISNPIHQLNGDIDRYFTEGKLHITTSLRNIREFHLLIESFSIMADRIRTNMAELQEFSYVDGLTGIANRRAFDSALILEWRRAQRDRTEIALLMIDVDHFKLYNDYFGHQEGDDCLHKVATVIAQVATRPGDLAARYGGEEFVALLPSTSLDGALVIANAMIDGVAELKIPHPKSSTSEFVTLSIGVATSNGLFNIDQLLKSADLALYRAKNTGRNKIQH
jgi:diguanylate cyclase (GGDEF)-like protein